MTSKKESNGRRVYAVRVAVGTPAAIEEIAASLQCYRSGPGGELVGAGGVLLDRIADGRLIVVPNPEPTEQ